MIKTTKFISLAIGVMMGVSSMVLATEDSRPKESIDYRSIVQLSPTFDSQELQRLVLGGSLQNCPLPCDILFNLVYRFSINGTEEVISLVCKPFHYLTDHLNNVLGLSRIKNQINEAQSVIINNPEIFGISPFLSFVELCDLLSKDSVVINVIYRGNNVSLKLDSSLAEILGLRTTIKSCTYQSAFKNAILKYARYTNGNAINGSLVLSYFIYNQYGNLIKNISFCETTSKKIYYGESYRDRYSSDREKILGLLKILDLENDPEIMARFNTQLRLFQEDKIVFQRIIRKQLKLFVHIMGVNAPELQKITEARGTLGELLGL